VITAIPRAVDGKVARAGDLVAVLDGNVDASFKSPISEIDVLR